MPGLAVSWVLLLLAASSWALLASSCALSSSWAPPLLLASWVLLLLLAVSSCALLLLAASWAPPLLLASWVLLLLLAVSSWTLLLLVSSWALLLLASSWTLLLLSSWVLLLLAASSRALLPSGVVASWVLFCPARLRAYCRRFRQQPKDTRWPWDMHNSETTTNILLKFHGRKDPLCCASRIRALDGNVPFRSLLLCPSLFRDFLLFRCFYQGPDQTQCQLDIPLHNITRT